MCNKCLSQEEIEDNMRRFKEEYSEEDAEEEIRQLKEREMDKHAVECKKACKVWGVLLIVVLLVILF